MIVIVLMLLRLIFNYRDPNPFGAIGKFSFRLKKFTDRIVYPSAGILAQLRMNTKLAPLVTILGTIVIGYFTLRLFNTLFFTIDGIVANIGGSVTKVVGFLLFGILGLLSLAIVIRIIFSWVMSFTNPVLRFLSKNYRTRSRTVSPYYSAARNVRYFGDYRFIIAGFSANGGCRGF